MTGPRPVKPSGLLNSETWASETQRTICLYRDEKVVPLAEAQLLPELGWKDQASPVSELNVKRFTVGHEAIIQCE